jgi:glutamate/aspartate transport system substrate-binding protein
MDDILLYSFVANSSAPGDYVISSDALSVEPYGIMLRRDDPAFERFVDRTLNEMFQSGEVRRIYARWFATRELTVPMNQYLKEAFVIPNTYPAWP